MISLRSTISLLLLAALTTLGCTHQYIANTDVEDTDFNRKVIEYCENYRHAVEQRNTARLLKMAHPSYYEDGGNVDASDDLDYAGLENYLNTEFNQTRAIRYEIHYRQISEGRKNSVLVDYTYSASYKIPTAHGDVWRRRVADNRLSLTREGDGFRILAGM
ncbi:MAG TPA: hypothetical protein VGF76_08410 [Polyangiaceae bacterium]